MKSKHNTSNGHVDRANRKDRAFVRAVEREHLTAPEQIAVLDARLGVGVGAARERARLGGAQ